MTAATTSYSLQTRTTAAITASLQTGDIHLIDELAIPWERLCEESGAEIFLTPQWIRCYLQAFEPETKLVVISVWAGERLLAILPLTHKWIWFRGIRLLELKGAANAHSVNFDVLRVPGPAGDAAVIAIWQCIRRFRRWHVLQLPYFPEGGASQEVLNCAAEDGFATFTDVWADSPYVPLQPDSTGIVNIYRGTSRHFRHELRRFARLLESHGDATASFESVSYPQPQLLKEFFALEAAGWKGQRQTAIGSTPQTALFYREIVRFAAQKRIFRLYTLNLEGRMIAGCFGVDGIRTFHGMKLTHDEALRRCAPGHLLTQEMLKDCAARGLTEVSLGGKADEYKKHWTSNVHRNLNGFIFNRSFRSSIVHYEKRALFPELRKWQTRTKALWTRQSAIAATFFGQAMARTKANKEKVR